MTRAALGRLALALFLAWRGVDSARVAWGDELATQDATWGWRDDDAGRLQRSLADLPAPPGSASAWARLELLRQHVPERAQVYLLHPFRGLGAALEFSIWQRFVVLLFPRVIQPLPALPLPASAHASPYSGLPVFLLDLRGGKAARLPDHTWVRLAEAEGASLYREREEH